jgi:hypothetical protein
MINACTISDTERPRGSAWIAALACAVLSAAAAGSREPEPPASAAQVRAILKRAEKELDRVDRALRGRDPGRVGLVMRAAGEQIERFETASGLASLVATIEEARSAAGRDDMMAATEAIERVRLFTPALADYTMSREVEVAVRSALAAARSGEREALMGGLERLDRATLGPVLLKHTREARQAFERGRTAMVRRDMAAGRVEAATARRSLTGLHHAGAVNRSIHSLRISAELLRNGAQIAARDQTRRALKDLKTAIGTAPESQRDDLEGARSKAYEIWRRMTRPAPDDATALEEISGTLESIREMQF